MESLYVPENEFPQVQLTPTQKLALAEQLYWDARALKAAFYRQRFPEKTESDIQQMVKEWMMYADT